MPQKTDFKWYLIELIPNSFFHLANVMSQFKPMPNKAVPHFDNDVLTGVSIDDCAQACISSFSYVCNSFEYQYATSYCLLSTLHPDEKPSMIQTSVGVDLYIRKYPFVRELWIIILGSTFKTVDYFKQFNF